MFVFRGYVRAVLVVGVVGPNPKLVIIATDGTSFFNCPFFPVRSLDTLCISHG